MKLKEFKQKKGFTFSLTFQNGENREVDLDVTKSGALGANCKIIEIVGVGGELKIDQSNIHQANYTSTGWNLVRIMDRQTVCERAKGPLNSHCNERTDKICK